MRDRIFGKLALALEVPRIVFRNIELAEAIPGDSFATARPGCLVERRPYIPIRASLNRVSVAAMFILAVAAYAEVPMTKLTIAVKTQSGRPVGQAAVIVRFV